MSSVRQGGGGRPRAPPAAGAAGLRLARAHAPAHVAHDGGPAADRLAVTKALTAIAPDHPELATARRLGIPVEAWQQVIADVAATRDSRLVGGAGAPGKSTSAGGAGGGPRG